ncbi:MAG: DUF3368 domain-containing protein [Prevotellaceae bacterium]|jgi:predicted nucleic acid-binding protein|nr:DUF3368 domain-containing protein [Prevotellaceae bacterium]
MIIVCDTSPIVALAIINELPLLDKIFDNVLIPQTVFNELTVGDKPQAEKLYVWAKDKICAATDKHLFQTYNMILDAGESEAMTLYWEKNSDFLLIDERKGRKIAKYNNIKIIGTLGILLLAKQKGYINEIKPMLDILQTSSIRIAENLYQKALVLAKE